MFDCVFELVFVVCVEDDAVLIKKTTNRRFPSRTAQKCEDDVEEPILHKMIDHLILIVIDKWLTFSPSACPVVVAL